VSEARASLGRLQRHGISPNRELGQNFLIDDNILGVIERLAELDPTDVVLEVGGGLGVLSSYLAERAAHLHVIETDARLIPVLEEALAGGRATLHVADVMDLRLADLDPAPGKVIANLPYGVAVPALLKTIAELDGVERWCVMVQREIADRIAARPGGRVYGVPSVLVQLACEVVSVRAVSRTVFRPAPHVDSALLVLRRTGPAPPARVRTIVRAAFAHRRKALARSLQLATGDPGIRDRAREALEAIGHPADERAERLAPAEFAQLAERLR
jgi:16S rRNA (adenine1518-N6/adenine1519-N6)-dimethyltransferase